jgi:hypothetical protein
MAKRIGDEASSDSNGLSNSCKAFSDVPDSGQKVRSHGRSRQAESGGGTQGSPTPFNVFILPNKNTMLCGAQPDCQWDTDDRVTEIADRKTSHSECLTDNSEG